jgi:hypothetical protein
MISLGDFTVRAMYRALYNQSFIHSFIHSFIQISVSKEKTKSRVKRIQREHVLFQISTVNGDIERLILQWKFDLMI